MSAMAVESVDIPAVLDGPTIAALLAVPRGTLRRWSHTGLLPVLGRGHRGVALYDYWRAHELAAGYSE